MFCKQELKHVFVDLEHAPISNDMLRLDQLSEPEIYYPLKVYVCDSCFLVQHDEISKKENEIFNNDYTYFSSYSSSWLKHAELYVHMMMDRFGFKANDLVMEIASNDGYLLKNFLKYGVPVIGIEPTANTAAEASKLGIESIIEFFGSDLVEKKLIPDKIRPNLIICNNVLAHVPDINDFVYSLKKVLLPDGIITIEFPHLVNLIDETQFDTIYHEHYSYLSLFTLNKIFESHGLKVFDCEMLKTHGGSLRIFATHAESSTHVIHERVEYVLNLELNRGINDLDYYLDFQKRVEDIKYKSLEFLIAKKMNGNRICAYGAASKGNTFINYCGIKGKDLIEFVVDASPHKQNKLLPGSHIPVVREEVIKKERPDYIVILPWNLTDEISDQLQYIKDWNGKFVKFIPSLKEF
jgi:SAM-dependent methyltransferase